MKSKRQYVCQSCGQASPKWLGQCPGCESWNTLLEETVAVASASSPKRVAAGYAGSQAADPINLSDVKLQTMARLSTGLVELDRVLGGGLVSGSVVLIGGDPGIGKSTLLLQALVQIGERERVLYVTGEESLEQIAERARRTGIESQDVVALAETNVERVLAQMQNAQPQVLVIDSIQTLFSPNLSAAPGSVSQVRECALALVNAAKQSGVSVFLVGHVTKEGALAGPRVLEHMVDTVLYFEGERAGRYRLIRAVKNRFGAVNELGVFAMTDRGLKEVSSPSKIFLARGEVPVSGSVVVAAWEGSRPLLAELQALVDQGGQSDRPRRVAVGIDGQRLAMLIAILARHGHMPMQGRDIFVNVVGGLRVFETAADLPVLLALMSSALNLPVPHDVIMFGEVGLAGEIRPVQSGQERLAEAAKHGFKRAIIPKGNVPKKSILGMQVYPAANLGDAMRAFRQCVGQVAEVRQDAALEEC